MQPRQRSRWVAAVSLATVSRPPPRPGSGSSGGSARAASPSPRPTAGTWGRRAGRSRSARNRTPARAARRTGRWATRSFGALPHQIPPANRPGAIRCPGSNWSFSARISPIAGTGPHMSTRSCTAAGARTTTALARAGGPSPPPNPGSRSRARRSRSPASEPGDVPWRGAPGHGGEQHARGGRAGHRRVQPGRPARGVHRGQHAGQGHGPEADLDHRAGRPGRGAGSAGARARAPPGRRCVQGRGPGPEQPPASARPARTPLRGRLPAAPPPAPGYGGPAGRSRWPPGRARTRRPPRRPGRPRPRRRSRR